ncbi:unnamed protein product [Mesocestoides corti]|uniref:Uncharacterized protein n=2 Tax=Mesocestoides corti TaxID=53468 RepID=A0A0R3U3J2_MESCO|nr:unnamed protein product [Mesocestoides corti]
MYRYIVTTAEGEAGAKDGASMSQLVRRFFPLLMGPEFEHSQGTPDPPKLNCLANLLLFLTFRDFDLKPSEHNQVRLDLVVNCRRVPAPMSGLLPPPPPPPLTPERHYIARSCLAFILARGDDEGLYLDAENDNRPPRAHTLWPKGGGRIYNDVGGLDEARVTHWESVQWRDGIGKACFEVLQCSMRVVLKAGLPDA